VSIWIWLSYVISFCGGLAIGALMVIRDQKRR
jgi:hypothetical protein